MMSTRIFFFFFFEKVTSFAKARSCVFSKSLLSLEAERLALFTTEKREVSSANSLTLVVRPGGRSLMQMRTNNGPRTKLCST